MSIALYIITGLILVGFTIFGLVGGRWLWKRLASSLVFEKGIPIYIKLIGLSFLIVIFGVIIGGFVVLVGGNQVKIQNITTICTNLMFFVAAYNIGYLIAIYVKPNGQAVDNSEINDGVATSSAEVSSEKASSKNGTPEKQSVSPYMAFKPSKRSIKIFFIGLVIWTALSVVIALVTVNALADPVFYYMMAAGVGAAFGWVYWENLKQTRMLQGSFLRTLKLLSLGFEIGVGAIVVFGMWIVAVETSGLESTLMLIYLLLFYLMAAYFLGLLIELMKR